MTTRILITNTNSVEGSEIQNYLGLISTNIVVGTNLFSDFGASLTDIFGGNSSTYQRKLQGIYKAALEGLKLKAENLGANAIIGLNIDFDEISGKGKSMFMISAIGTAVRIKYNRQESLLTQINNDSIPLEILKKEVERRVITKKVESGEFPEEDEWEYIINNPINEISDQLLELFFISSDKAEFEIKPQHKLTKTNFRLYIQSLDPELAAKTLYSRIRKTPSEIIQLICDANLFQQNGSRNYLIMERNL